MRLYLMVGEEFKEIYSIKKYFLLPWASGQIIMGCHMFSAPPLLESQSGSGDSPLIYYYPRKR